MCVCPAYVACAPQKCCLLAVVNNHMQQHVKQTLDNANIESHSYIKGRYQTRTTAANKVAPAAYTATAASTQLLALLPATCWHVHAAVGGG